MLPSQVRTAMLAAHKELDHDLDELEWQIAWAVDNKAEDVPIGLTKAFDTFFGHLMVHMQLEDKELAPELRDADAFGDVRTAQLDQHHLDDLDTLAKLFRLLADPATQRDAWVPAFRDLIKQVRAEVAEENAELLGEDVLRDDVITIDGMSG